MMMMMMMMMTIIMMNMNSGNVKRKRVDDNVEIIIKYYDSTHKRLLVNRDAKLL